MADRVFPNNSNVEMGSKLTFNTIDWNNVESNMNHNKFADDQTKKIKELLKLSESSCHDEDDEKDETKAEEACDASSDEFVLEEKTASNKTMKKIAFTHPSQISAEAIEEAQKAGDTERVETILAARKANRMRIAKAIEGKLQKQSQINKLSQESLTKLAQSQGKNASSVIVNKLQKTSADKFTSPTEFTSEQRNAFDKTAMSLGFPKGYVSAMCAKDISQDVLRLNNDIKAIYSSAVSENVKTSLVTKLVKEAELSPESKKEFIDYWNNELGYQDKEFWPMVAEDYTENKKVN